LDVSYVQSIQAIHVVATIITADEAIS
jgi:hypothetical protein